MTKQPINGFNAENALTYFSSLTGIHFHSVLKNADHTFPHFALCKNCTTSVMDLISAYNHRASCNLFFCPSGLCHIFHYCDETKTLTVSEPLFCGSPSSDEYKVITEKIVQSSPSNKCSFVVCLTPDLLLSAARLFQILINKQNDDMVNHEFFHQLSFAVMQSETETVKNVVDKAFECIVEENGLDFLKTKTACVDLIFTMLNIIKQTGESEALNGPLPFYELAEAKTLGELKEVLIEFCEILIRFSFKTSTIRQHSVIEKAVEMIETRYTEKITQNTVANAVFLSHSYFSKLFKEVTGYTFSQYLNMVRIKKAKELLATPFLPIDAIYRSVGFESRSYFGKIFHRLTGITPKQYRDAIVNQNK